MVELVNCLTTIWQNTSEGANLKKQEAESEPPPLWSASFFLLSYLFIWKKNTLKHWSIKFSAVLLNKTTLLLGYTQLPSKHQRWSCAPQTMKLQKGMKRRWWNSASVFSWRAPAICPSSSWQFAPQVSGKKLIKFQLQTPPLIIGAGREGGGSRLCRWCWRSPGLKG